MSGIRKDLQFGDDKYDLSQIPRKRRRYGPRTSGRSGPKASIKQTTKTEKDDIVTPEEDTELAGCSAMEVDWGGANSQLKYEIELLANEAFQVIDNTTFAVHDFSLISYMLQEFAMAIMDSFESPEIPFKVLTTRFEKAPRYVVYDNAYVLHNFCLNREAYYFKDTWFLGDRLHYSNHKACSEGYRLGDYPEFSELNSQAVEQVNASFSKLRASFTYMNNEHFNANLQFFLWYRNKYVLKR